MIVRDQPQRWSIESECFHGPNVVICEVVTNKRTPLIEAYRPPSTPEHLPYLAEDLTHFRDQGPIVLGDLNANTQ